MSFICHSVRHTGFALLFVLCCMSSMSSALARQGDLPYSLAHPKAVAASVSIVDIAPVDAAKRRLQVSGDAQLSGPHTKRLRVADDSDVALTPESDGSWETLPDGSLLWRLAIRAAGATDMRVGFSRFDLPVGASLYIIGADAYYQGPYEASDASEDLQFRTPVVPGDTLTIELRLPSGVEIVPGAIEVSDVGAGFRDLFRRDATMKRTGPGTSGACNINVVCPLGEPYTDESRAIAYYEFNSSGGTYICTANLLVDIPNDFRNFLLTAAHCVTTPSEAASMVVYWNYQSSQCSQTVGWTLNDNQIGASLRATRQDADFTLVELSQPPDPAWNVFYAGWDASGAIPRRIIALHHPSGDVEKVTSGPQPTSIPNCIGTGSASRLTHWLTGPYNSGTTEGGSSGSGLFVPADDVSGHGRLLIGVLSGGDAQCSLSAPSQPDGGSDCYGKFSAAWDGMTAASRLKDWLDPQGTGQLLAEGQDASGVDPLPPLPSGIANRAAASRDAHTRLPPPERGGTLPPHRTEQQP